MWERRAVASATMAGSEEGGLSKRAHRKIEAVATAVYAPRLGAAVAGKLNAWLEQAACCEAMGVREARKWQRVRAVVHDDRVRQAAQEAVAAGARGKEVQARRAELSRWVAFWQRNVEAQESGWKKWHRPVKSLMKVVGRGEPLHVEAEAGNKRARQQPVTEARQAVKQRRDGEAGVTSQAAATASGRARGPSLTGEEARAVMWWAEQEDATLPAAKWRRLKLLCLQPAARDVAVQQMVASGRLLEGEGGLRTWAAHHGEKLAKEMQGRRKAVAEVWQQLRRIVEQRAEERASTQARREQEGVATLRQPAVVSGETAYPTGVAGRIARTPVQERGEMPAVRVGRKRKVEQREMVAQADAKASARELLRMVAATEAVYGRWEAEWVTKEGSFAGRLPAPAVPVVRRLKAVFASRETLMGWMKGEAVESAGWERRLAGCAVPTLTASGQAQLVLLWWCADEGRVRARRLGVQVWLTLMGVPMVARSGGQRAAAHRLRRWAEEVGNSDAACKALVGQAVDYRFVRLLVRWIRERVGPERWQGKYADLMSGISLFGVAVEDEVGGEFQYLYAAEWLEAVLQQHRSLWRGAGLAEVFVRAHAPETEEAIRSKAAEWGAALVHVPMRCAPFSKAHTRYARGTEERMHREQRALEEVQQALKAAAAARPVALVVETAANIMVEHVESWRRLQGILLLHEEFEWGWQRACPAELLGAVGPRDRVWLVGVRRQE